MPDKMNDLKLTLTVLPETFAVCRLDKDDGIPEWAYTGSFYSVTRTPDELSIVCPQASVAAGTKCENDFRCLRVEGPLDFSLTGIMASLATALGEAKISIIAISTYDTDYLLVRQSNLGKAIHALSGLGHTVRS